jgi:predicted aspartyl protease
MGLVRVNALIGNSADALEEVTFMVDTGSFYTALPPRLAQRLGIRTTMSAPVVLADNRVTQVALGMAYMRLLDREAGVPIGVMEVPKPLLGVTALEALGLKVNPVELTLEHARPYGAPML